MKRHNEAWKDSLRYGRPDLDSMFGIRRITMNSNPLVCDSGVKSLAEAFKGDLWLKALDLQNCGVTTVGASYLLEGLKFNAMMHVLDVRLNANIDRDMLQKIMEQVMINSSGNNTEYEWMPLTQTAAKANLGVAVSFSSSTATAAAAAASRDTQHAYSLRKVKKRRTINSSFSKKSQYAANTTNGSFKMKRCKSTGSVVNQKSPTASAHNTPSTSGNNGAGGGIPWRAAARANRYRISDTCPYRPVTHSSHEYNGNESDENGGDEDDDDDDGEEDEDEYDTENEEEEDADIDEDEEFDELDENNAHHHHHHHNHHHNQMMSKKTHRIAYNNNNNSNNNHHHSIKYTKRSSTKKNDPLVMASSTFDDNPPPTQPATIHHNYKS